MTKKVIVIGGGNHHNTLGVIRSLGKRNIGIELISLGNLKKNFVASSKYVTNFHALLAVKELSSFLLYRNKSADGLKEIVISCSDEVTEHLNIFRNKLIERYILPGTTEEGKMVELMDKTTMISMASKLGLFAPQVWKIPSEISEVTFPCITKAIISSHGGKSDIVICKKKEELNVFQRKDIDEIIAQEYIIKKEEVQFIGCSLRNGDEVIIPGMTKILRSQPNTNTGFLEYDSIDPFYNDIVKKSKQYIKDCQYSGLFSIEFLRGLDDMVYFLEINFRNDGNAYSVMAAGINLPLIWVKANSGEKYEKEIKLPKSVVVMPEFQDFKLVLQQKISIVQWVKDWKRTNCFLIYDKRDKKPFFKYIFNKIL